ncbi:MAG TPA: sigma-54 dependent transcriptional regulator [Verrucomicrobiae bacterium]|nr:sigma-54 dependent transcriptional regulator [Verrucomicrobiae bacterium]
MPARANILLVDDDERLRNAAGKVLAAEGYRVTSAGSGQEALDLLGAPGTALVISDLRLPDLDGNVLLQQIRERRPEVEVVMITGHGNIEKAVEAMKLGACDFIEKPLDTVALLKTVASALSKQRLAAENIQLRRQLERQRGIVGLIGDSPALVAVKQIIRQIAPTNVGVLIGGESGTGKEIVADAIHLLSDRHDKPLLKISCAAIPDTLLESELFGHERGAFTGATATKPGKFELADGGTLFLDEIAEMSPPLQAKLLRVLQDGSFQRLGSTKGLHADVRLLSATHADIPRAIAAGGFRQDLYYRINTIEISLPPLRERGDDIPLLAEHFLRECAAEMHKEIHSIAPAALDQLRAYSWPGNVRELEHVIQRAVALATGDTIAGFSLNSVVSGANGAVSNMADGSSITIPIGTPVDEATRRLVEATIRQCGGNKLKAARVLGIPPRTMYRHFSDAGTEGLRRTGSM